MKIYSDGKSRVLKGEFPSRFKLYNAGVDVPFIRIGKDSIRLSGELPVGDLDVEEIIREKVAKPSALRTMNFVMVGKEDIDRIDVLNQKLAINQDKISEQIDLLAEHEAAIANLETNNEQAIKETNETIVEVAKAFGKEIQADRESLVKVSESFTSSLDETAKILSNKIDTHVKAKNPHKITKATIGLERVDNTSDDEKPVSKPIKEALDKKADKSELENVAKKIEEVGKKHEDLVHGFDNMNLYGGVGGESIAGGKKDQVLTKNSSKNGDYSWRYMTGSLNVDGGHADTIYTSEQLVNGGKA